MKKCGEILLIFFLFIFSAYGSDLGLSNITRTELKKVNGEFAANKKHTTVTAASLLPEGKKYEAGLILGSSQADTIGKLSEEQDASNDVSSIPYAGFFGIIALPKNLNGEVILLPMIHTNGFASGQLSGAIKWSPKDMFNLPLNLAVKSFVGVTKNEWEQSISGGNVEVTSTQTSYGLDAQVSKKFFMVEPYLNLGVIQTHGTMESSGSVSIFDSSYSSGKEESVTLSGLTYAVGAELDAWFMKVGVEYGEVYTNTFLKAKVSAQF